MRALSLVLLGLGVFLAASDSHAQSAPSLVGSLVLVGPQPAASASQVSLRATVRNTGATPRAIHARTLDIAQLTVDVTNASGRRIPTIPPPVPRPEDAQTSPLAPGASRTFSVRLGVFSPDLAPGTYRVTWGAREGIVTPSIPLVIAR